MLWGPICTRGNLTGSVAKMGQQLKRPNRRTGPTALARIWVQGGKMMGFVALDCDWPHNICNAERSPWRGHGAESYRRALY